MRRLAIICALVVVTGCGRESAFEEPDLGASDGEVRLVTQGEPSPGARVTFDVEADKALGLTGGVRFRLYHWHLPVAGVASGITADHPPTS